MLGAFSSAFFLYGIALAYAVAGTTRLDELALRIAGHSAAPTVFVLIAIVLLLVGFAFKVSAVPFHMWTPDAYQGAPTLVTGFMSTGVKAAAFAAFVRVFLTAFEPLSAQWMPVLAAIAIATMIVGTVVGVAQTSVKRMLAYSSIAHAGYLLVGLVAGHRRRQGGDALLPAGLRRHEPRRLRRSWRCSPAGRRARRGARLRRAVEERAGLAALLTVFLLSLGGFPPTVGFIAKWYIFTAAVQEGHYALAILGVLTSVISVFFYLRIVVLMYMTESTHAGPWPGCRRPRPRAW